MNKCLLIAIIIIIMILFIIPSLLLVRMKQYNIIYPTYRTERINLSLLYEKINTGDLVLFVSPSYFPSSNIFTHTYFTHVGFVYKENNNVYISESQNGTELMPYQDREIYMEKGAVRHLLLPRIKYYTGKIYIMKLKKSLSNSQQIIDYIKSLDGHPYPTVSDFVMSIFKTVKSRHCFQHVGNILNTTMKFNLNISSPIQICRDICSLHNEYYEIPKEIVYDI